MFAWQSFLVCQLSGVFIEVAGAFTLLGDFSTKLPKSQFSALGLVDGRPINFIYLTRKFSESNKVTN